MFMGRQGWISWLDLFTAKMYLTPPDRMQHHPWLKNERIWHVLLTPDFTFHSMVHEFLLFCVKKKSLIMSLLHTQLAANFVNIICIIPLKV